MPKVSKLYNEKLNKSFLVSSVCRMDLTANDLMTEEEASKISDSDMEYIASKMEDAFCETDGYWLALEEAVNCLRK